MKKKPIVKALESRLNREKFLSEYSFSLAILSVPFLEWIRSFLIGSDPEEQLFFDNFIFVAYVVMVLPIAIRGIATFFNWIKPNNLPVYLSKRQMRTLETYKLTTGDLISNVEMKEQALQTLYLYAMNNLMWFHYILIGMFAITTVALNLLFSIPITLFNAIPSLMLLIYKVFRIEIKKRRVS
ncbi:MAG: hypothetical protein CVV57_10410 [Tenericutes bacterium HGW-Tenericutes-2]|jgi:hypothetical protein|nr:MAG: hypothetical protein CVV57_10410 [Tenericutes bacterium HGW-Tenericutes-2]